MGANCTSLVYNITESQFYDIDKLRENVFELVDYLNEEGIVFALAHPLLQRQHPG